MKLDLLEGTLKLKLRRNLDIFLAVAVAASRILMRLPGFELGYSDVCTGKNISSPDVSEDSPKQTSPPSDIELHL